MKKKIYIGLLVWLILSIAIFCLLPWIAFTFVIKYVNVGTLHDLFVIIDLIYFIALGIYAGKNIKKRWFLPIISFVLLIYGYLEFFYHYFPITLFEEIFARSYNLVIGIFVMIDTDFKKSMKKRTYIGLVVWLALSIVLLYLLPWVAFTYVIKYVSIITLNDLFLVIELIYFIVIGIFSGKNLKTMWSLPIISYIILVYGTLDFFNVRYPYLDYVALENIHYLAIGVFAMLVTALCKWYFPK